MANFKPSMPYSTPILLYIPTKTIKKGVEVKTWPSDENAIRLNCSFKTYGGTDLNVNGILSVTDTAYIETWYRPDIKSDCRFKVISTGAIYEVLGSPENIEMRNQFIKIKVKTVEGGA